MVTATATGSSNGKQIIVLGLSWENLRRLKECQPIHVDATTHAGFPEQLSILIFSGETESTMARQMRELIGPETKVVAVPRDPQQRPQ
jgi:hypothetical protein